jgi:hypothetical protein
VRKREERVLYWIRYDRMASSNCIVMLLGECKDDPGKEERRDREWRIK